MNDIAIKVSGVSKNFRLPHQNQSNSIKSLFLNPLNIITKKSETSEVQHALKDISFEIKKGEFFGIVGRNGSGKSTLLKILAGIYQPSEGSIEVNGKLVPFIELGVGFNPELSGRENVYLNGALLGFDQKKVEAKYKDIVAFAELERFMDQKLKNYSSGMQVRLAFSVATVLAESDILLIDEVLAVGDADFQRKCFEYFKSLKKNKKTVVFVSHDMDAVREYCDRGVMIDKNKVVAAGTSESIAKKYTRLFSDYDSKPKANDTEKVRWGDGRVMYQKVSVDQPKITSELHEITIRTSALAYQTLNSPNFGITIKDSAGVSLFGTNTRIKLIKIPTIEKGETITLEWKIPNIFSEGKYFINPAVVHSNGMQTSDWWEEAAEFTVVNEEKTPYNISPKIGVRIING